MSIGVAVSTTGHPHRMGFLETAIQHWLRCGVDRLVITVDGSDGDAVRSRLWDRTYRVGQPASSVEPYNDRLGVAVNKNTGLELLMDAGVEHLFLCDDDTYPIGRASMLLHTESALKHSMVCWGKNRFLAKGRYASWKWPRGVMLYARREVVEAVGGMDENFGLGGHEHAEWSRRIFQHGFTPEPFCTPLPYAESHRGAAMGARGYWHAEDMPNPGEPLGNFIRRKRRTTTLDETQRDWVRIKEVMSARDGDTTFVPFRAKDNGRLSATLCRVD